MKEYFLTESAISGITGDTLGEYPAFAMLHGQPRQIQPKEEWNMGSICVESLEKELERHVREMKRARNFIRGKRGKTGI